MDITARTSYVAPTVCKLFSPLHPDINKAATGTELSSKELDEILDSDPYTFMFRK